MDVFDAEGVRFGLEVHPTEIAYDFVTTRKTLDGDRPARGIRDQLRPVATSSHQLLDSARFVEEFADRIYHVHVKDSKVRIDGRRSILGSHLNFGEGERGWDFVSPGHGDVDFEELFRALNRIGYEGPLSIEWEDSGMDRELGRAGRARVRAAHATSAPPTWPSTRRCSDESLTGIGGAPGRRRGRNRPRSASGCSGTPSWARRTRTR